MGLRYRNILDEYSDLYIHVTDYYDIINRNEFFKIQSKHFDKYDPIFKDEPNKTDYIKVLNYNYICPKEFIQYIEREGEYHIIRDRLKLIGELDKYSKVEEIKLKIIEFFKSNGNKLEIDSIKYQLTRFKRKFNQDKYDYYDSCHKHRYSLYEFMPVIDVKIKNAEKALKHMKKLYESKNEEYKIKYLYFDPTTKKYELNPSYIHNSDRMELLDTIEGYKKDIEVQTDLINSLVKEKNDSHTDANKLSFGNTEDIKVDNKTNISLDNSLKTRKEYENLDTNNKIMIPCNLYYYLLVVDEIIDSFARRENYYEHRKNLTKTDNFKLKYFRVTSY